MRLRAALVLLLLLPACAAKPRPAFSVFHWWWQQPLDWRAPDFYVRNDTSQPFDSVLVTMDLFDAQGRSLGERTVDAGALKPGEVSLTGIDIFPEHPHHVRVREIRGRGRETGTAAHAASPPPSPSRVPAWPGAPPEAGGRPPAPPSARPTGGAR